MGEKVVNIDFGTRKRIEDISPEPELPPFMKAHTIMNRVGFLVRLMDNPDIIKLMRLKPHQASLITAQQQIRKLATDQLMSIWEKSTEHDWVARPAFFQTALKELKKRLITGNQPS